jgi:hypothetical protein
MVIAPAFLIYVGVLKLPEKVESSTCYGILRKLDSSIMRLLWSTYQSE